MKRILLSFIILILGLVATIHSEDLTLFKELFGEGGYYGWSICGLDFNDDGFQDVAIGAPMYSGSVGSSQGIVYVYFGGPDMDTIPDLRILGTMEREQFGISLSNAGDLNGDGADDLVVGGNVTRDIGGAYIFFGGALLDSVPDITTIGEARVDNYGYSVTGVGDINEDGFDDILIGALYNDARGPRTGKAYLYFGGEDMDSLPDMVFTGRDSLDDFSCCLDGDYDFNNDGVPDFIVGAVQAGWASSYVPDSLVRPGEALIFYGGTALDSDPDIVVRGENPMDFFGGTVSGIQDFNGDGYDDFISGGYHYSEVESVAGRAYLYLSSEFPDTTPDLIMSGRIEDETFGDIVADPGDINGDGFGDLLVGASKNRDTGISTGVIYIYYGGEEVDPTPDIIIFGEREGDRFGWACETIGDINGDLLPDLAVSAPRNDAAGENAGKVYIFLGFTETVLYWQAELIFTLPGYIPTRLTIGQYSLGSDGYDRGIDDLLIPPPPDTRTDARIILDDPENEHVMWLSSDYRSIDDTATTWSIFTSGSGEATIEWDPESFGNGVFLLNNYFDMKAYDSYTFEMGDTLRVNFHLYPMSNFMLEIEEGWNMISLPLYPKNYIMSELFDFSGYDTYVFDASSGSYYSPERYPTTHCLFLYSPSNTTKNFIGYPMRKYTVDIIEGWNHIGSVWNAPSVSFLDPDDIPDASIVPNSLYEYSPASGYILSENIETGKGYWVLSRRNCKLNVNSD
ncbi:FG-GAP repeat protein [bacterium]|nr:FG-GAP repeat protein [bacterium]